MLKLLTWALMSYYKQTSKETKMMLQNLMENYLNNKTITVYPIDKDDSVPVEPVKNKWSIEKKSLKKVFNFKTRKQKEAFVLELLKYDRDSDCVLEIRIKKEKVAIILHALSPEISEIEFEAKVDIDKIRKDVVYYFAKKD